MTLVFETHATTIDNETGHATGWLPGQLSAIGRAQARELGLRRRDEAIDVIVASDLRRAVETVEVAFSGLDVPVSFDSRLRECNYGRLNGAPVTELRRPDHLDTPYPDGESWWQAVDRVVRWLAEARVAYEGRGSRDRSHRNKMGARRGRERRPAGAFARRPVRLAARLGVPL
jgi:2,3-bisphosphoglycerate-dependent phosphoglycerate mutase